MALKNRFDLRDGKTRVTELLWNEPDCTVERSSSALRPVSQFLASPGIGMDSRESLSLPSWTLLVVLKISLKTGKQKSSLLFCYIGTGVLIQIVDV